MQALGMGHLVSIERTGQAGEGRERWQGECLQGCGSAAMSELTNELGITGERRRDEGGRAARRRAEMDNHCKTNGWKEDIHCDNYYVKRDGECRRKMKDFSSRTSIL
ncbi:hypothetical protein WR25_27059 [Diploscapter pachys]|uniref:Uncharacterized protein n=1 Tax=Diploscapter pachys TaxID=2018661 RepID=A0A2A2KCM0_9BILA|nr:hypothetical protein WR25_27059 [Diploscapter pachys]